MSRTRWGLAVGCIVASVLVASSYAFNWRWTGLSSPSASGGVSYKTVWDWLDLLIVPAALAVLGFWFSSRERRTERSLAEARARSETLLRYIDSMSAMIADDLLPGLGEGAPSMAVARARTLTAVKQLDGAGRGVVLQFLYESRLIGGHADNGEVASRVIDLTGGDCAEARLDGINLSGADLRGLTLTSASLRGTNLSGARLRATKLQNADLRAGRPLYAADWLMVTSCIGADLESADLSFAKLDVTFEQANLQYAKLNGADLGTSRFRDANLVGAEFDGANLSRVEDLDPKQLALAGSFFGAKLADGSTGLAPQKLQASVTNHDAAEQPADHWRLRADVVARVNVLPLGDLDFVVGVFCLVDQNAEGGGERPLLQNPRTGKTYVVSREGMTFAARSTTAGQVAATVDLPVHSPEDSQARSVTLHFRMLIKPGGEVVSLSIVTGSLSDGEYT